MNAERIRAVPGAGKLGSVSGKLSLNDRVFASLREALLTGTFAPGERISENQLAEQLEVSKTPVREALRALCERGLLEPHERRGFVVSVDAVAIHELYASRALVEPAAVQWATANNGPEIHQRARRILDRARSSAKRKGFDQLSQLNREFHELLYERCNNHMAIRLLGEMKDFLQFMAATAWRFAPTYEAEQAEHEAILEAVTRGDGEEARRLVLEHIEKAEKKLIVAVDRSNADDVLR